MDMFAGIETSVQLMFFFFCFVFYPKFTLVEISAVAVLRIHLYFHGELFMDVFFRLAEVLVLLRHGCYCCQNIAII